MARDFGVEYITSFPRRYYLTWKRSPLGAHLAHWVNSSLVNNTLIVFPWSLFQSHAYWRPAAAAQTYLLGRNEKKEETEKAGVRE